MSHKTNNLIQIYKEMSPEKLQIEIDAMFDIIYAILEATESDSIESYPNPNIKLKFSCEVIPDGNSNFIC
jgi:hypothetical protein